jgi:hypothetical protein
MRDAPFLSQRPKGGRPVQVWIVESLGMFTAICPELPRVGARDRDPDRAYARCRDQALDVIVVHQNAQKEIPWVPIQRKPPVDARIRRFTLTTTKL